MISICIPIYNFNVTALIQELSYQAKTINLPYEIILIDDKSSEAFKRINEPVCNKEIYIPLGKNIGRAKIRNLFLAYSKYESLLFLDCDSLIVSKDFLAQYIKVIIENNYSVVCGGRVYDKNKPGKNKMLRWKYGIEKESQPLHIREKSPNKSFMTNNILISRKIFEKIKFDERIIEYGHEDTLYGFRLMKEGIKIKHIDNPVLNADLEDNLGYLSKTEMGVINLINILGYVNYNSDFIKEVTILNFYKKIISFKMVSFIKFFFFCLKPIIRYLLIQGYISISLFNFYKLGILLQNSNQQTISGMKMYK